VDGDEPWSTCPYKSIDNPESARLAPVGKVEGSRGIFYVPVSRGALTRVTSEAQVQEPVEATYIPGEEELVVKRKGLAGKFEEVAVDEVTCVIDRRHRPGEKKQFSLPKDTVTIPVTGDMIRVDPRRPGFEDAGMPAALASEVAPNEGEDPEFVAQVKGLVGGAGLSVTVHGKTPGDAEKPTFTARFVKRNMGFGVYTDVLTLTPFDAEDAEAVLAVHADSSGKNTGLRVDMTEGGVAFEKFTRHGEKENEVYFTGVSVRMPFSRKNSGEFMVPVGDDMQESGISYKVTGRDTGQVTITQPDGSRYEVEILSSRGEQVKVTHVEAGGVYLELSGDAELRGFIDATRAARRGMYDEMSRTEGLARIFSPLFRDVAGAARAPEPAVAPDTPLVEPLNPAKHWDETRYGRHPDPAVRSLLPEHLKLPPPYPRDLAVDSQPLGYRAVYPPDEWYKPRREHDPFDDISAPYPQGFEMYQRMGLLVASERYVKDVLSGRIRGTLLTPLSQEPCGMDLHVGAHADGTMQLGGMGSWSTHWVRTNLMRGSCECTVNRRNGRTTHFKFYAMETPLDDLAIQEVAVHSEAHEVFPNVNYRKTQKTHHRDPVYEAVEGPLNPGDEPAPKDKTIRLDQANRIPGLSESQAVTGVREIISQHYRPFGPGNVLIGTGSGFGIGLPPYTDAQYIDMARRGLVYTPGPQQDDAFRRNLGLGFLEED
jgi:hypothetical protein